MKRIMMFAVLMAAGCASSQKPGAQVGGSGYCSIAEVKWPSAARDFDRRTTLEVLGALAEAAEADHAQLKAGARGEVGTKLDENIRRVANDGFVSRGVAELGVRLRQLDCAVKSGRVDSARASALYGQILAELQAERATLEPRGGGTGAAAAAAP